MTQPTPYRRGYNFRDAGGAQPPGGPLDTELDSLQRTIRETLRNMALLQRDDAQLRNGIVGIDQLDNRVLGLISGGTFSIAGTWATATSYPAGAFLTDDGAIYLVMEDHTSTSIVDDLAAGRIAKALQNEQGNRIRDDFTGNAVQTAFTLSQSPARPSDVEVYVDGALILPDDYAQTGATVTFDVAPANGAKVSIFSITWATTPPIQTLVDAVGDRNTEISAATEFLEEVSNNGGTVFVDNLGGDAGATELAHKADGTGAIKRTLNVLLNRMHVWVEDYATRQQAVNAAISRKAELWFQPGKEYTWDEAVSATGKLRIVAHGARIVTSLALTALTFSVGADGSEVAGGEWVYTGPKTEGYNAGANGILFTGTRNGLGVAPTYLTDVAVSGGARFDGWGNGAVEYRYTKNSRDTGVIAINCGYYGVFVYSGDLHRSENLFVNGLSGQIDGANAAASELNAYGFTATAQTGGGVDRTRDPRSRDIFIKNATIMNVPTWHALDTHGAENMQIDGATIVNCRRGVVFTALADAGATNCTAKAVIATNTFDASDVNANGTSKKGEAFWDVGSDPTHLNSGNRFDECSCFGHGNPGADEGAVTIGFAVGGYYDIDDEQSHRLGWLIADYTTGTIRARTTNVRHASADPYVARIDGYRIKLTIESWRSGARDPDVDTKVMEKGLVVAATNDEGTIDFEDFDLRKCLQGEMLSTAGNTIAAELSGNYSFQVDLTLTGVDAVVTSSVRLIRQGRLCMAQVSASGITGTSNSAACTLTGIPESFWPSASVGAGQVAALDGSNYILAHSTISNAGVITLTRDADNNTSAWTASGTKGVRAALFQWAA